MGDHLARLVLLAIPLGGCSLLYDPDRLAPAAEGPAPPVKCESLAIERVYPDELLEGQGTAGSRPAVLVISGQNIAAGAMVSITPHDPADKPALTVDMAQVARDRFGTRLAVPIALDVDPNLGATSSIRLDVTVTQPCAASGGTATSSLRELEGGAPALTLRGLVELTGTASVSTALPNLYSRVDVTGLIAAGAAKPLIIRSTSSITIGGTQPVSVSAMDQMPGPGGFGGGNGGEPGIIGGAGNGSMGGGPGGGIPNGGGAGFSTTGGMGTGASSGPGGPIAGDAALVTLESPNRGSGGAGGKGAMLAGGQRGGAGGGGGGSIELTAAGDLNVMVPIEARGGTGSKTNASSGGGGSGGVVLIRAGGRLTLAGGADAVTVAGGLPGDPVDAGAGAPGRIRIDGLNRSIAVMANPAIGYRGPMFGAGTPSIVAEVRPRFAFIGQPSALVRYTIEGEDGTTRGPVELTLSSTGDTAVPLALDLFAGYNKICALVTGVINRRDEAESCITLAYIRPE